MFANADELLKYVQDEGVEFIDVRFCDLPGVMQRLKALDASRPATPLPRGPLPQSAKAARQMMRGKFNTPR